MKKLISILALLVVCVATSFAQGTFSKGDRTISGGISLSPYYGSGDYTLPPIAVMYDWGFNDDISIGAYASFATSSYDYSSLNCSFDYTYIVLGARGAYHFYKKDKLDIYGGLFLGYNIINYSNDCDLGPYGDLYDASDSEFAYAFFGGVRYYFTPKLAAFGELGYGLAALTLGVSYKLK